MRENGGTALNTYGVGGEAELKRRKEDRRKVLLRAERADVRL